MNIWDIVLSAVIVAAAVTAIAVIIRNKKHGKGCCGDCTKCCGCDAKGKQDK